MQSFFSSQDLDRIIGVFTLCAIRFDWRKSWTYFILNGSFVNSGIGVEDNDDLEARLSLNYLKLVHDIEQVTQITTFLLEIYICTYLVTGNI